MSLSTIALAVYLFLQGGELLNWFSVSAKVLGVIAVVTAALFVLEAVITVPALPLRRVSNS